MHAAALLRKEFQQPQHRAATAAAAGDDLVRDLSDYDRAFGLADDQISGQISGQIKQQGVS